MSPLGNFKNFKSLTWHIKQICQREMCCLAFPKQMNHFYFPYTEILLLSWYNIMLSTLFGKSSLRSVEVGSDIKAKETNRTNLY